MLSIHCKHLYLLHHGYIPSASSPLASLSISHHHASSPASVASWRHLISSATSFRRLSASPSRQRSVITASRVAHRLIAAHGIARQQQQQRAPPPQQHLCSHFLSRHPVALAPSSSSIFTANKRLLLYPLLLRISNVAAHLLFCLCHHLCRLIASLSTSPCRIAVIMPSCIIIVFARHRQHPIFIHHRHMLRQHRLKVTNKALTSYCLCALPFMLQQRPCCRHSSALSMLSPHHHIAPSLIAASSLP